MATNEKIVKETVSGIRHFGCSAIYIAFRLTGTVSSNFTTQLSLISLSPDIEQQGSARFDSINNRFLMLKYYPLVTQHDFISTSKLNIVEYIVNEQPVQHYVHMYTN